MAYEDVIINTLVRALEAKNTESVEGVDPMSSAHMTPEQAKPKQRPTDNEADRDLLRSWSSLYASHSGFGRLISRLFHRI